MQFRRNAIQTIAGYALLAGATGLFGLFSGCSEQTFQFKGVDITGADYAKDFSLSDHHGRLRTMADFKGKVVVVFFGYTQCPDVCPTTMAELADVKKQLGKDGDKLQALFISIDPERDTPEVLKAYMENFDPGFLALRPAPDQVPELARQFKIYTKKVEGKTPTSYTMDHSAGSYVYDTQGRVRLFVRYGSGPAALVSDIQLLLKAAP